MASKRLKKRKRRITKPPKRRQRRASLLITDDIKRILDEAANVSGRSPNQEAELRILLAFEWQEIMGNRLEKLMRTIVDLMAEVRKSESNFLLELRRRGWAPIHGTFNWKPPGVEPQSGFTGE